MADGAVKLMMSVVDYPDYNSYLGYGGVLMDYGNDTAIDYGTLAAGGDPDYNDYNLCVN